MLLFKRILFAALAGAVVIFILAGLFFGVLFADFFAGSIPPEFAIINRPAPVFPLILAADALYALMLAVVLDSAGVRTFARGALFGGFIGFAVMLHFDLIMSATTFLNTPLKVAANVVISSVMSAAAGAVIAAVLGWIEQRTK
ncbi:MAG: hypothetical protein AB7L70_13670 [Pyrinomonadaceae bacterium]